MLRESSILFSLSARPSMNPVLLREHALMAAQVHPQPHCLACLSSLAFRGADEATGQSSTNFCLAPFSYRNHGQSPIQGPVRYPLVPKRYYLERNQNSVHQNIYISRESQTLPRRELASFPGESLPVCKTQRAAPPTTAPLCMPRAGSAFEFSANYL